MNKLNTLIRESKKRSFDSGEEEDGLSEKQSLQANFEVGFFDLVITSRSEKN